jgi:hypothetical protein
MNVKRLAVQREEEQHKARRQRHVPMESIMSRMLHYLCVLVTVVEKGRSLTSPLELYLRKITMSFHHNRLRKRRAGLGSRFKGPTLKG